MTSGAQQRILIVDDNEAGRYAQSRVLRKAGYEVVEAGTGSEGLRRVAQDQPDLIILDVRLPDINGVEVCRRIKSDPDTRAIPIVQMSAAVKDEGSRVAALEGGAETYLVQPVGPELLLATVGALLRATAAEQALREAAMDWQATFDAISDGIALLDEGGRVRRFNEALPALLELNRDAVAGRCFDELLGPAGERGPAAIATSGRRITEERTIGPRSFRVTIDPMSDPSGHLRGAIATVCDVTEHKRMDERLGHAQKLESIGLLAGGVAHDFNNLLLGIMGNASLAIETPGMPLDARHALKDVISAGERAAALTSQLLAYAGKGRFVIGPVELSSLVEELAPLLHVSVPRTVDFTLNLGRGLPAIEGDKAQIGQVAMNLIINAAEAFEGNSGSLKVTTKLRRVERAERDQYLSDQDLEGNYVALEVSDTGKGMDKETQSRIFDPFFSTKFLGRGLGLSAVLGIIRGHRGAIRVQSAPGQGTTFEVLFPATAAAIAPEPPSEPARVPGQGTILVVDDEEFIRRMMTRALSSFGYDVLLAENGAQAIELMSSNSDRIALVLLDLVMPVMSGDEALPRLLAIKPDAPIIISSGQAGEECKRKVGNARVAGYIQKPYSMGPLLEKIRYVLNAR